MNLFYAIVGGFVGGLTASVVFKKFWLTNREVEDVQVMRQVRKLKDILPDHTKVMEWQPKEDEDVTAFTNALNKLDERQ